MLQLGLAQIEAALSTTLGVHSIAYSCTTNAPLKNPKPTL